MHLANYVQPAALDAASCVAYGPGLQGAYAGQRNAFTIELCDKFGNLRAPTYLSVGRSEAFAITVKFSSASFNMSYSVSEPAVSGFVAPTLHSVLEMGGGLYSLSYVATQAEVLVLTIFVTDVPLPLKYYVHVSPHIASPLLTSVTN
jgi:hypothetical protein